MAINTPTAPKQGVRARERNALQRIEALETDLMNVFNAVQQALNNTDGRVTALAEILDAVVAELGPDTVNARVLEGRQTRAKEQADTSKKALAEAVEKGQVVVTGSVTERSIIVGREIDKDGVELFPGYVQLAYSSIKPEFQTKIAGQAVGFQFDTAEGGKFEITALYEVNSEPPKPVEVAETPVVAEAPVEVPATTPEVQG